LPVPPVQDGERLQIACIAGHGHTSTFCYIGNGMENEIHNYSKNRPLYGKLMKLYAFIISLALLSILGACRKNDNGQDTIANPKLIEANAIII
jgi:hypothetical protein